MARARSTGARWRTPSAGAGGGECRRSRRRPHDAALELHGRLDAEAAVDALEAGAEEVVEAVVLAQTLVLAEPPEPVASLGRVDGFEGRRCAQGLRVCLAARDHPAASRRLRPATR